MPQGAEAFFSDAAFVDGMAVDARDRGDVFRTLHASFDLYAGNAQTLQLPHIFHKAVILEAQGIFFLKTVIAVGQATRLGALSAVAAASANDG